MRQRADFVSGQHCWVCGQDQSMLTGLCNGGSSGEGRLACRKECRIYKGASAAIVIKA